MKILNIMTYLDTHPLHAAFFANKLDRLAGLIAAQGEELLRHAGLDVPSRAVSLMLLVGEHSEISATDIAYLLEQPHQLVTQRAELLIELELIERKNDPGDGRRKILVLTAKGKKQFAKLQICLSEAASVFTALFEEIECDLADLAMRAMKALNNTSVLDRTKSTRSSNDTYEKENFI